MGPSLGLAGKRQRWRRGPFVWEPAYNVNAPIKDVAVGALDQRRQSLSSVIKTTSYPAALTMARPSSARRATNNDAAQSKVAFLNEAWGGEAWMPEDVRAAMFNKNKRAGNQVVVYLARITKLAQKQDISLSSLWLPGGTLRDAVDRGPNAPRLTGDLAKEVYEHMKENAVPAVHSTDPSVYSEDDLIHEEDTVDEDLPQTPLKKPRRGVAPS
ncbi:hypothetical protein NM208_g6773 [Fusarium decemcellulare]|uniref:Uncharacterized protein n=1 Tax=Fusarium decemcellulare TaxID=57161 RepID=A0ACC1SBP4_9HYPO|nr:hypothetical protein NM208_g6773 [Fusarium decemcellulare]